MAARGCVYVLEMSRSHLRRSRCPAEGGWGGGVGGRRLVYRWPVCFLSLLTYARAILSSLFPVSFVS